MIRLLCLAIGYLFGLFQTSYILGRVHGIDIREYGSHNAGTTNMLRTMGLKAGLLTFAGDCGKCILAVVLVRVVFGKTHADILPLLEFYAAAGTILGHNYPFYLGFRGGKGIADHSRSCPVSELDHGDLRHHHFFYYFLCDTLCFSWLAPCLRRNCDRSDRTWTERLFPYDTAAPV